MGRPSKKATAAQAKALGKIPPLAMDCDSIAKFTAWVARRMVAGHLTATIGRELLKAAGTMGQTLRTKSGLHEMDQLRELVRQAQEAVDRRKLVEAAARYGQGDAGEVGRRPYVEEN